jgi:hypothetical protein
MLLYIDPGSGSIIIQALIAGALTFVMFFKHLKYKILNYFGFKGKLEDNENDND